MKHMPAPDRRKLIKLVKEYIVSRGAVETPGDLGHYRLETPLGGLRVSFNDSHNLVSIFTCFADPKRAVTVLGSNNMNPYSGKCNFHFGAGDSCDGSYQYFAFVMDKVFSAKPPWEINDKA